MGETLSIYEYLALLIALGLPFILLLTLFVSALGRQPGYRRRRSTDSSYKGPERRCLRN